MKWVISNEASGMFIKSFLLNEGRFSKRLLIKAKSPNGSILVNGEKKTVRYMLQTDDVLEVILPSEQPDGNIICEEMPLDIVYEDNHLLVINKPTGIASIPSRQHLSGTIANGLLYYYKKNGIEATVHIVTRLDRDTSGLMLIAKSQHCHALLSGMQRARTLGRTYVAIVDGVIDKSSGTINRPIGRKSDSIIERIVTQTGKSAITHFNVVKRFAEITAVEIELETGRTHQIRVHFSSLGHPLTGDKLYGGNMNNIGRQALHCSKLSFIHPLSAESLCIEAPLPKDIRQLQETLSNV